MSARTETVNAGRVLSVGPMSVLWRPRTVALSLLLLVATLVMMLVGLDRGSSGSTLSEVWFALRNPDAPGLSTVLWELRMPRVLAGVAVGAELASSGAVFQSLSRNALGSPDIIGFTSGAAAGAVIAIVIFQAGPMTVALSAVVSGAVMALVVYALSWRDGALGTERLVLVGIGMNVLVQSLNTIVLTKTDAEVAIAGREWLTGTLNARSWQQAWMAILASVALIPVLFLMTRRLNTLEFGEDLARQAGVPVESTRTITIAAGVGLIALATAATGPIGFVALAAPHLVRRLLRAPSVPVVPSALAGALLLISADVLSQSLPPALRVPVGITTSVIGGTYLLWMVGRQRR